LRGRGKGKKKKGGGRGLGSPCRLAKKCYAKKKRKRTFFRMFWGWGPAPGMEHGTKGGKEKKGKKGDVPGERTNLLKNTKGKGPRTPSGNSKRGEWIHLRCFWRDKKKKKKEKKESSLP